MIEFALGMCAGLVLGWIFLPEPKFVRDAFVRIGWASQSQVTPES